MFDDFHPFVFPDVTGRKVLFLGLGGGSDIILAYALARTFCPAGARSLIYGNTKKLEEPNQEVVTRAHPPADRPRGSSAAERTAPVPSIAAFHAAMKGVRGSSCWMPATRKPWCRKSGAWSSTSSLAWTPEATRWPPGRPADATSACCASWNRPGCRCFTSWRLRVVTAIALPATLSQAMIDQKDVRPVQGLPRIDQHARSVATIQRTAQPNADAKDHPGRSR